ncbi:MAG: hypothetical protein QNJ22_15560, partial [Desulfosarcinaceae bacterium]|nr:hypothetical protein [Desulfosarcinaceae bacterium]
MISEEGVLTIIVVFFSLIAAYRYGFGPKRNGRFLFLWILWDLSGFRAIFYKLNPESRIGAEEDSLPPATFVLWFVGVYVALFGLASQRYENRIDVIENQANSLLVQLSNGAEKRELSRIRSIQNLECPEKPELMKITSVFRSLFFYSSYDQIVTRLKEAVEDYKKYLSEANLSST